MATLDFFAEQDCAAKKGSRRPAKESYSTEAAREQTRNFATLNPAILREPVSTLAPEPARPGPLCPPDAAHPRLRGNPAYPEAASRSAVSTSCSDPSRESGTAPETRRTR